MMRTNMGFFVDPIKKGLIIVNRLLLLLPFRELIIFHINVIQVFVGLCSRSGMDIIFITKLGLVWQWFQNPQFGQRYLVLVQ